MADERCLHRHISDATLRWRPCRTSARRFSKGDLSFNQESYDPSSPFPSDERHVNGAHAHHTSSATPELPACTSPHEQNRCVPASDTPVLLRLTSRSLRTGAEPSPVRPAAAERPRSASGCCRLLPFRWRRSPPNGGTRPRMLHAQPAEVWERADGGGGRAVLSGGDAKAAWQLGKG